MKFLLERGVPTEQILLHGHSLGGAVAVSVRARHPGGPVVNDRSFGTLAAVVTVHPFLQGRGVVPTVLCALAGGLFVPVLLVLHGNGGGALWALPLPGRALVAGVVGTGLFRLSAVLGQRGMMPKKVGEKWAHPENLDKWDRRKMTATIGLCWLLVSSILAWLLPVLIGTIEYTLAGIMAGVAVGQHTDFILNIAPSLLYGLGWHFDIAKIWRHAPRDMSAPSAVLLPGCCADLRPALCRESLEGCPKLLLYHKHDLVVPFDTSLYAHLLGHTSGLGSAGPATEATPTATEAADVEAAESDTLLGKVM